MRDRETAIRAFLDAAGWAGAERASLAGDASPRRYERLHGRHRTAVLMDAPPPETVAPFAHVTALLRDLGLSAPAVFARDDEAGFLLLEDFGDRSMAAALAAGEPAAPLYRLATDILIALHRAGVPEDHGLPPYDTDRLLTEARLFPSWYAPAAGLTLDGAAVAAWDDAWRDALRAVPATPAVPVLRDFFPDNLMLLDRHGVRACGLLDVQDAVIGHPAYDLASLVEDARREVPAGIADEMLSRYLDTFPALDRAAFTAAYTVLAAQRHAKVIGIFTRLARRDGKPAYLRHIPRVWQHLDRCLAHPALAPVARWLHTHVPPGARRVPGDDPA